MKKKSIRTSRREGCQIDVYILTGFNFQIIRRLFSEPSVTTTIVFEFLTILLIHQRRCLSVFLFVLRGLKENCSGCSFRLCRIKEYNKANRTNFKW